LNYLLEEKWKVPEDLPGTETSGMPYAWDITYMFLVARLIKKIDPESVLSALLVFIPLPL